ncbi:MAG: MBL fold metallo-hydrolase [Candidatus Nitrosoglobus sp.]|jgi:glyoxylase-like metal-dependent hydrolase (beta-lactamase superfamily II)
MKPQIHPFFDPKTSTISYIVRALNDNRCALIDPVLDYDPAAASTSTVMADQMIDYVHKNNLNVEWILETHAHADHLTAACYLKKQLGGRIGIGEHIIQVQERFGQLFNLGADFKADGSQFDHLFADGEHFRIGALEAQVLYTPGHTPACITYLVGDVAFVGDTLFMPDYGTARADFPGGDAGTMYRSIQRIYELPEETRLFMCHDYPPTGREPRWETTVAEQKARNPLVKKEISEKEFVQKRMEKDRTLAPPVLILPSLQVNIRAGEFPLPENNGVVYLKLPLNQL